MIRQIWKVFSRFWETDKSLSTLLLLLIASQFVLPTVVPTRGVARGVVIDVVFSLLLVAGTVAVWRRSQWAVRGVVAFGLVAVPMRWAALLAPSDALEIWKIATSVAAVGLLTLLVLAKVLGPGTITSYRLQGAVAAYLLLGALWAQAYELVALKIPGAFANASAGGDGAGPWTYYSFVTLTTMGYGDITPLHPIARSLATAEALTGQLYLAIMISRLVALELQSRRTV